MFTNWRKGEEKSMRLIDKDALLKELGITDEECSKCEWGDGHGYCTRGSDFSYACDAICTAQTVEERKKGKWILHTEQRQEDVDNGNYLYVCSNCDHSDLHAKSQVVPFCWFCGADMRGES